MTTRLTDEDLKIRHSAIQVLLVALGYVADDSAATTVLDVQRRLNKAVDEGHMAKDAEGHYRLTREFYDRQVKRNGAQPRRRDAA
jgi:proteasome assembly chaperone (PAC2) family protein